MIVIHVLNLRQVVINHTNCADVTHFGSTSINGRVESFAPILSDRRTSHFNVEGVDNALSNTSVQRDTDASFLTLSRLPWLKAAITIDDTKEKFAIEFALDLRVEHSLGAILSQNAFVFIRVARVSITTAA